MQLLINLPLLELSDDLHIFLADGVLLEIVEFGGVVGEVKQVDSALVLFVKLFYVVFEIEIEAEFRNGYLPSRTIFSVSYFFDCEAVHLLIYSCLMCIAF